MAMASCSQARALSPTHAALIAKWGNNDASGVCVFFYRKKFDCAAAFAKCLLFAPQSSIDQAKHAQCRAVVWLRFDDFLLLHSRSSKSGPRFSIVFDHTSDKTFHESSTELDRPVSQKIVFGRRQGIGSRRGIAFCQCASKPAIGHTLQCDRIFRADFIDQLM